MESTEEPSFKMKLRKSFRRLRFSTWRFFLASFFTSIFGIAYIVRFSRFLFENIKKNVVYKLYWGRGGGYKQFLHLSVLVLTLLTFFSGVSYRLFGLSINSASLIQAYSPTIGNVDLLEQGGNIETVFAANAGVRFKINEYIVKSGDNLQKIADDFKVTKLTIKDSNRFMFGTYEKYNAEKVNPGDKLSIPEVNGLIYDIEQGDTFDSIVAKTSSNKFDVASINQILGPDYKLEGLNKILIPNGRLAPPKPRATVATERPRGTGINVGSGIPSSLGITFSNPLSHPACGGYVWFRGFSAWHNGVDLGKNGGCPIRAACDGKVTFAGWGSPDGRNYGEGYNVTIDCGKGVRTQFFHGNGTFWVKVGDQVVRGQEVMYMGQSGRASGVHLHLSLRYGGFWIDPAPHIPY